MTVLSLLVVVVVLLLVVPVGRGVGAAAAADAAAGAVVGGGVLMQLLVLLALTTHGVLPNCTHVCAIDSLSPSTRCWTELCGCDWTSVATTDSLLLQPRPLKQPGCAGDTVVFNPACLHSASRNTLASQPVCTPSCTPGRICIPQNASRADGESERGGA